MKDEQRISNEIIRLFEKNGTESCDCLIILSSLVISLSLANHLCLKDFIELTRLMNEGYKKASERI